MPKYRNGNFIQLNREVLHDECTLTWRAKWLYVVLSELEHRYTGEEETFFFRSQEDLARDTGMDVKTNLKYRKELEEKGWIKTWKMHWQNPETGKKSSKYTIAYRLLK
ncbi:MAG: helix-turn-helix domain-containing protein [Deltaproteobacteria bacterium]|nr:helix-turn-helix domain-containing protein [Deltaproteobacteria bacterium]